MADDLVDPRKRLQIVPIHPERPTDALISTAVHANAKSGIDDVLSGVFHALLQTGPNFLHGRLLDPSRMKSGVAEEPAMLGVGQLGNAAYASAQGFPESLWPSVR
ncbi:MAG: hypothetical protein ABJF10_19825 [Chthoniobacter sp.]